MNEYLKEVLEKFNVDKNNPELSNTEKVLLSKLTEVEKNISNVSQQMEETGSVIESKNQEMNILRSNLLQLKGQSQGIISAILALKNGEENEQME